MIRRDLPFEKLEIDFDAVERRKELEYEKLDRVVRFALGGACRQREILRYFGEEDAPRCGHCDNCRLHELRPSAGSVADDRAVEDQITGKVLEAVIMVLSGVARTQDRLPCGKNLIAQMLCGSNSAKVAKLRLNKLSTFGLLRHLTQPEVVMMIDSLGALRCLQQVEVEPFRPVVQLTDFGREVMRGKALLSGMLPAPGSLLHKLHRKQKGEGGRGKAEKEQLGTKNEELETKATRLPTASFPPSPFTPPPSSFPLPPSENQPPDAEVLDSLKRWRSEIADEAGVPLHYIFGNDTLAELARCRPKTREQLLAIKGIGPVKAERYGITLLEIVGGVDERGEGREERGEGEAENGQSSPPPSSLVLPPSPVAPHPSPLTPSSHYWTRRLLAAGFTVEECAAIRGLSREVILEHARHAED
jgi:ATP-dependent DNA helicase RecQ